VSRTSTDSSSPRDPERARVVEALQKAGLRPSRKLGQSFLVDPFVADAEAALTEAAPGTPVLEIGPGLGALTEALLRRGIDPLTVMERDARLAAYLRGTLGDRVRVVEGDALEAPLPEAAVVVGNLPFSVATPMLLRLLKARVPRIVVMVQAEVADRLLALPGTGEYGRLTLLARLHADIEGFLPVPPEAFEPVPAVSGRVVVFTHRSGELPVPDEAAFEELTRKLFGARRKQLKNLLPRAVPAGVDPAVVAREAGWPDDWARRRPEELPWDSYFRLAGCLGTATVGRR
jgi:16S rRNA (adenine1518-N6/adenine1519-N6)-dimethyltransferase